MPNQGVGITPLVTWKPKQASSPSSFNSSQQVYPRAVNLRFRVPPTLQLPTSFCSCLFSFLRRMEVGMI